MTVQMSRKILLTHIHFSSCARRAASSEFNSSFRPDTTHINRTANLICTKFSAMLAQKLRSTTETSEFSETQSLQAVKSMLQACFKSHSKKLPGLDLSFLNPCSPTKKWPALQTSKSISCPPAILLTQKCLNRGCKTFLIFSRPTASHPSFLVFTMMWTNRMNFLKCFTFTSKRQGAFQPFKRLRYAVGQIPPKSAGVHQKKMLFCSATSMIRSLETLLGTMPTPSSTQKFMSIKLIARDGKLSSRDFSKESAFSCGTNCVHSEAVFLQHHSFFPIHK